LSNTRTETPAGNSASGVHDIGDADLGPCMISKTYQEQGNQQEVRSHRSTAGAVILTYFTFSVTYDDCLGVS
jgi:hypothetical protein